MKKIAVLGTGNIAQTVAVDLKLMGMRCVYLRQTT